MNDSAQHRHECEVREVISRFPENEDKTRYLAGVRKQRGEDAFKRLRNDVAKAMGIMGKVEI